MSDGPADVVTRNALPYPFDPLLLQSALAGVTERIGLVATVSTTYLPPYHLARKFATLDPLSGGRAGWNLVTSGSDFEARSFGLPQQLAHAQRYEKAHEYVQVVKGLWDSWEDDAFIHDKESNRFFDTDKLHRVAFEGKHYTVHGSLQAPRAPQGYPVLGRPAPATMARTWPPPRPNWCSPPSKPWKMPAPFTPASRAVWPPMAVAPMNSRSCLASPRLWARVNRKRRRNSSSCKA